jgi:hypothetical protein
MAEQPGTAHTPENRQSVYDEALTDIINVLHECSRITEGIEGKTLIIRNNAPVPSSAKEPSDGAPPQKATTQLAEHMAEALMYGRQLRERLDNLEKDIII